MGKNASGSLGRGLLLILLIIVIGVLSLAWFDYLGLIDAKGFLAPGYRLLKIPTRGKGRVNSDSAALLELERGQKEEAALQARSQELDKLASDLNQRDSEINQKAQELEERQKALDDQENSFNEKLKEVETRGVNIEQNAQRLTSMPPANAVKILEAMDDQDIVDILRKVDDLAKKAGTNSIVPYWMSKMDPQRAATIQRKMTEKPVTP